MTRTFAKGLFYFVMIVLFLWTASLTVSFVSNVLPGTAWYVPLFSLVAFDIGMIAWMVVFVEYAEGAGQRATALALCIVDFIGVALMSVSEIFLGGQTLVAPPENLGDYALWGIGVWTAVNVAGIVAFHLLDPSARKKMAFQTEKDAIFDEAFSQLKQKRVQHSARLAGELSDGMFAELQAELAVDKDRDGVPDMYQTPRRASDGPDRNRVTVHPLTPDNEHREPRHANGVTRNRMEAAYPTDNDEVLLQPVSLTRNERPQHRPTPQPVNGVNEQNIVGGVVGGDEEDGSDRPFLPRQ